MKAQRNKPKLLLVSRPVGWAYDIRCIALEQELNNFFQIQRQMSLNTEVDLVYFPGAEMLRRGLPFKKGTKLCATVGGLSCFSMADLLPDLNKRVAAFSIPNILWYNDFKKNTDKEIFYIPNGVNTKAFTPGNRLNCKEFVIGWVGNDKPARMHVKRIDILRKTCQELGIKLVERNWNHNHINHSEMPNFYRGIDLYINTSTTEGSNNPILEACSASVPVLGTPVGNMPELLSSGATLISQDLSDLRAKIEMFRDMSPQDRKVLGIRLRSRMVQEFDWNLIAVRYKEMFDYSLGSITKTAVNDHYISRSTYHHAPKSQPVEPKPVQPKPVKQPKIIPPKDVKKKRVTLAQRRRERALLAKAPKEVLISVAMTCYNQGTFIEDAIKSVVNQTYKNWEIVIVDDCSVDNSITIIQRCVKRYGIKDKVRVLAHKQNGGCGKSLRDAIENSSGELVAVLDSDDALSDKEALKICAKTHEKHPEASLTYSNYQRCNHLLEPNRAFKTRQILDTETLLPKTYSLKLVPEVSHLKVFKKGCYDLTSGVDPKLPQTVDKDLVLKLEEVGSLIHIDKELYLYRKQSLSLTSSLRTKDTDYQNHVEKMRRRIYDKAVKRREQLDGEKISVVMTCYNRASYIEFGIQSIVEQNYCNWELIIVDDCSTDNSISVINKCISSFGIKDKVILIQHKENLGCGNSLREGIENSTGELIAIVDSDDALLGKKAFEICVKKHKNHPEASMTYSNFLQCNESMQPLRIRNTRQIKKEEKAISDGIGFNVLISHLKVVKRSYYDKTDGVDDQLRKSVDKDLITKLEEVGDLVHINKALYSYRKHNSSLSNTLHKRSDEDMKVINSAKDRIRANIAKRKG